MVGKETPDEVGGAETGDQLAQSKVPKCSCCGKPGYHLKTCTACKMAWYCDRTCQLAHRNAHKKACKHREKELKAAAAGGVADVTSGLGAMKVSGITTTDSNPLEAFDLLNPRPKEDCPVCLVKLPISNFLRTYKSCCGKILCSGCAIEQHRVIDKTNLQRKIEASLGLGCLPRIEKSCAFCREPTPTSGVEALKRLKERVEKGDHEACHYLYMKYNSGGDVNRFRGVVEEDKEKALEMLLRAADLGSADACFDLVRYYKTGEMGLPQDFSKERRCLELAARGGEILAHVVLGCNEMAAGNFVVGMKHTLFAASAGDKTAANLVDLFFERGLLTEAEHRKCVKAHHEAREEVKTDERDKYLEWAVRVGDMPASMAKELR